MDSDQNLIIKTSWEEVCQIGPDGKTKWTNYIGPVDSSSPDAGENGFRPRALNDAAPVSSPSIDVEGTIYLGAENGTFHAINPDGTRKWIYTTGGPIKSSPAIGADGIIYFGCNDGNLYMLRRNCRPAAPLKPPPP